MPASASVYTLAPYPIREMCSTASRSYRGRIWLSQGVHVFMAFASGLAEAQRLELGPNMGFNWIGSARFFRVIHKVVACGPCWRPIKDVFPYF